MGTQTTTGTIWTPDGQFNVANWARVNHLEMRVLCQVAAVSTTVVRDWFTIDDGNLSKSWDKETGWDGYASLADYVWAYRAAIGNGNKNVRWYYLTRWDFTVPSWNFPDVGQSLMTGYYSDSQLVDLFGVINVSGGYYTTVSGFGDEADTVNGAKDAWWGYVYANSKLCKGYYCGISTSATWNPDTTWTAYLTDANGKWGSTILPNQVYIRAAVGHKVTSSNLRRAENMGFSLGAGAGQLQLGPTITSGDAIERQQDINVTGFDPYPPGGGVAIARDPISHLHALHVKEAS